ncbi:50S ribosomal protein L11 methyltransferase [Levilactobacillus suantsaii]|uniref:Ribosomal protein L11 methyltransferase n=1 Tax=Levilactobacillus suantsaii TaxID=2292255 RepID=A0A4Q0VL81_9LACO|nr:50S ribosomal protein L11 methyltransferase [Levilactobacillus suantsaii]QMU07553.1 50S ribosomal protein L11 methyltransferase [Levilactobacillus suantsaii]RXI79622.1 50S ribosomal protein L11 methyltransferase [Levilactobacillus suantsaii]
MQWTEVSVLTTNEAVEAVSNILQEAGASGVKIDDAADYANLKPGKYGEVVDLNTIPHRTTGAEITAYYPETVFVPEILPTIKQRVAQLSQFGLDPTPGTVTTKAVADESWATAWQKYYHPVRVTRYLTVTPSWEAYEPVQAGEQVIRLDPGMAFGTGTHPTTILSLMALETVIRGGESLYDVGTGSGVLSIAAKALGADHVEAFDLDDVAVRSAKTNLDLNPVAKDVVARPNNLLNDIHQPVDIVVANILAEIIVSLVPQAWENLQPGGHFLTSGIIADKLDTVVAAQEKQGFIIDNVLQMKDWRGVIAHKPTEDE